MNAWQHGDLERHGSGGHSKSGADKLEAAWKSGQISSPIEAMIFLERQRSSPPPLLTVIKEFSAPLGVLLFLILAGLFWMAFFPLYNFCWGDYLQHFNRRQAIGRFVLVAIVLATGVGIFVNYASQRLGIGR